MAEYGAHLNQNASSERPTFFEVIAQESMTTVLRPAITYALKVIASYHPGRLGWLWKYGDEIYLAFDYALQNHYLKRHNGTFSEHFYGLKRCQSSSPNVIPHVVGQPSKMSHRQRYMSVFTVVFIPYLKMKLDQYFIKVREDGSSPGSYTPKREQFLQHLKRVFLAAYPFVHCTWETIFLCYHMMYLFSSNSMTHSPLLHWIGLHLQRLSRQDILHDIYKGEMLLHFKGDTLLSKMLYLPNVLGNILVNVLSNGLPLVVFFLKFLEWWYSSENTNTVVAVTQLPIPPPPPQPKAAEFGVQLPSHPAQCPLCKNVRTNPAVLTTSGYVFCYPCIYRHLNQHGCCPVTHLPSSQQQLVRLFMNTDN
ncbi:peroxisome assembly protein 12 [Exaiptasia diaphana]|uniref:Peroxisome assembly protein 12 n=1 Tax=Exaiptasia diaphana TaxID=2652724 RepID=A0A913YBT4_EXADI|nr:peroxisome assembly protein 12 [Exaiptasia diaphana]KXJ28244.1 Peroxisome assembly protein 12 [Exaiptasia diaphana]